MKEKIIMNKKISLLLFAAIVIASLSVFSVPASADTPVSITPGGYIHVNENYCEFQLTEHSIGVSYDFSLSIGSGNHIIQTFGGPTRQARLELYNATTSERVAVSASREGHGNNTFIQYDFDSSPYTLRITPQKNTPIRISITKTDGFFNTGTPIYEYEDITQGYTATADFYFETNSPAVVFRFKPDPDEDYVINTEGSGAMRVYFMDPTTNTGYAGEVITGEGDTYPDTLSSNVNYYVVMYLLPAEGDGDEWADGIESDHVTLTVTILPI